MDHHGKSTRNYIPDFVESLKEWVFVCVCVVSLLAYP